MKKQIIFIHYTLPPKTGGIENILGPLSEVFADNDYLVTMLTGAGKIVSQNIKTSIIPDFNPESPHIVKMQKVLRMGSLPENYEIKVENIRRRIETEIGDIDNIVIHNVMSMPYNLPATEALFNYIERNSHKNFYLWTHDLAWLMDDYKNSLFERKPWSILKTPIKNVKYITVSEYRKRQMSELLKISKKQISVVPNVLKYQDFLRFDNNTIKIITELSLFHKHPLILIPSRIIPRKNLERSIKLIGSLKKKYSNIKGVITGIPDLTSEENITYYKKLLELRRESNLEDNIIFLDQVFKDFKIPEEKNRNVVHDLYFISQLVLLTSIDEGFGLQLLEAGAARIPIAVTQLPVFREIAGENALYLPNDESPDYNASRIEKYLVDNQSKTSALFTRIFNRYNWDSLWKDYIQFIFK